MYLKKNISLYVTFFVLIISFFIYIPKSFAATLTLFQGTKLATHGYEGSALNTPIVDEFFNLATELELISEIINNVEIETSNSEKEAIDNAMQTISEYIDVVGLDVYNDPEEEFILKNLNIEEEKILKVFENVIKDEKINLENNIREKDTAGIDRTKKTIINTVSESLKEVDKITPENKRKLFIQEFEKSIDRLEESLVESDRILTERVGLELFRDSDEDGVTDFDEINIYKTDPENFDTDGDGVGDGLEIQAGLNPKSSSKIKILYEDPRKSLAHTVKDVFSLKSISVVETKKDLDGNISAKKIKFTGTALPNSYVTLYIYSTPIIVTVKADNSGLWTYILDEELTDGTHEMYVAQTDSSGRIIAQSNPIPFIKQVAAVELSSILSSDSGSVGPSFYNIETLLFILVILIVVTTLAFVIVGFLHRRHRIHYENALFEGEKEEVDNNG